MPFDYTIAIAGNPNCGKTALFNALTGSRQKVGNWPGVTVEQKTGQMALSGKTIAVVDLPGTYSLTMTDDHLALDLKAANDYLLSQQADCIINIIDGTNLERNLYLTAQLLEMRMPMIIGINMMDVVKKRGIDLDLERLSECLGCPVVPVVATQRHGISSLQGALEKFIVCKKKSQNKLIAQDELITKDELIAQDNKSLKRPSLVADCDFVLPAVTTMPAYDLPGPLKKILDRGMEEASLSRLTLAEKRITTSCLLRLMEGDCYARQCIPAAIKDKVLDATKKFEHDSGEAADILIADRRYRWIRRIVKLVYVQKQSSQMKMTGRIDRFVLSKWFGIPVFLGVMYMMFVFAINMGGVFQDFFDISSQTVFVDAASQLLMQWHVPVWLIALLTHGVGKGINTTLTFIPVIGGMFLFLALLEDSGYMARAAFVMDRCMRAMGLPGRSFVPMIVGFGCNVPAVMGARAIGNSRDRILTVMMTPFMSCGARLAIFAVFVSSFFPHHGQNIVFLLYLLGITVAVLTGLLLRQTLLPGRPAPLVMELPPYRLPQLGAVCRHAWQRLSGFVVRAGRYIVPFCVLLGVLNSMSVHGKLLQGEANRQSVLSLVGQKLTVVFSPMGIQQDNWPATVGLLTGVLAKEVVIGSLNTLYSQQVASSGATTQLPHSIKMTLEQGFSAALHSIPNNIAALPQALFNPIAASQAPHDISNNALRVMHQLFASQAAAFAYLIFVLLYFPCVSTMAAVRRELGAAWCWFSTLWSTGIAYATAVFYYQLSQFFIHPLLSLTVMIGILFLVAMVCYSMRFFYKKTATIGYRATADL